MHRVDAVGAVVLRRQVERFFAKLPRCLIGIEACDTAHHWARRLGQVPAGDERFRLFRGCPGGSGLDLGGAEFEFGNFADRVELRVGEDVGGGLGIAERDKHHPRCDIAVGARLQFDHAAPGGDAHRRAG